MYYREVKDGKKWLKSTLLLLTKSDAEWAAAQLNASDPNYSYKPSANALGYEGYDGSVHMHELGFFPKHPGHFGKYVTTIDWATLRDMCKDRPIVHQSESYK